MLFSGLLNSILHFMLLIMWQDGPFSIFIPSYWSFGMCCIVMNILSLMFLNLYVK